MESQELRTAQQNLRPEEENEQYTRVSHLSQEDALDEQVDEDEEIDEE
jgi:hypothetical protein